MGLLLEGFYRSVIVVVLLALVNRVCWLLVGRRLVVVVVVVVVVVAWSHWLLAEASVWSCGDWRAGGRAGRTYKGGLQAWACNYGRVGVELLVLQLVGSAGSYNGLFGAAVLDHLVIAVLLMVRH